MMRLWRVDSEPLFSCRIAPKHRAASVVANSPGVKRPAFFLMPKQWIQAIKTFQDYVRGDVREVDERRAKDLIRMGLAVPYEATQEGKMAAVPLNKMMPQPENKAEPNREPPIGMITTEPPLEDAPRTKVDGPSVRIKPGRRRV